MRMIMLAFVLAVSAAQAFDLKDLSRSDLETIGAGLGKLPRETTDEQHGNLWVRLQTQITQQVDAEVKANKAAFDKAVADAAAKASPTPQPEMPQ
jgi:hypothetical protein